MKVCVVGTGYVGLVTGACLADVGNEVLCVDTDAANVACLRAGELPIHEPGLDAIVLRCVDAGRLHFTADPAEGARFGTVQFIAVADFTRPDRIVIGADDESAIAVMRQLYAPSGETTNA